MVRLRKNHRLALRSHSGITSPMGLGRSSAHSPRLLLGHLRRQNLRRLRISHLVVSTPTRPKAHFTDLCQLYRASAMPAEAGENCRTGGLPLPFRLCWERCGGECRVRQSRRTHPGSRRIRLDFGETRDLFLSNSATTCSRNPVWPAAIRIRMIDVY